LVAGAVELVLYPFDLEGEKKVSTAALSQTLPDLLHRTSDTVDCNKTLEGFAGVLAALFRVMQ